MPVIRSTNSDQASLPGRTNNMLREANFRTGFHEPDDRQEDRAEFRPETINEVTLDQCNLPEIPWRKGYVQRWIRLPFSGDPRPDGNFNFRWRQGWRPRPLSTIGHGTLSWVGKKTATIDGLDGLQIGNMLLVEMPEDLFAKYQEAIEKKNKVLNSVTSSMSRKSMMQNAKAGLRRPDMAEIIDTTKVEWQREGNRPATLAG